MTSKKLHPKYGIISDPEKAREYHLGRRMFVIINEEVHYAPCNSTLSHRKWFIGEGWMTEDEDSLIDAVTRGYINQSGVYFYTGYDFRIDRETEATMLKHLQEIVDELYLDKSIHLFGGKVKQIETTELWPHEKDYGRIENLLSP